MQTENEIKALWQAAKTGLEAFSKVKNPSHIVAAAEERMRGRYMVLSEILGYDENCPIKFGKDKKKKPAKAKKPDIEYGIHSNGSLKIWCNCPQKTKPKKGQVICEDCAEYFTDKLQQVIDNHITDRLEEVERKAGELDQRTIGDVLFGPLPH